VSDSFTKFTGSIGKGLTAATMDKDYQDRRRLNMARNRPKHALVGVTQGATSFANSVASGFSGLVVRLTKTNKYFMILSLIDDRLDLWKVQQRKVSADSLRVLVKVLLGMT
jgi:hypothetical protein